MPTKRVQVYDANTDQPLMQFDSVKECADYFGVDSSYLSYHFKGRTKTIKKKQYYCRIIEEHYYNPDTYSDSKKNPYPIDIFKDGELIGTYDNVKVAANISGVAPPTIYRHCRGQAIKPTRGYTFKYNKEKKMENKKRMIDLFDAETNELYKSFDSAQDVANFLGLSLNTIRANLRGESKTIKVRSFYCKYRKE